MIPQDFVHNNAPIPPTPLVGRQREVTAVCDLLLDEHLPKGNVRLLTLTGTGGIGKTRLVQAVITRLVEITPVETFRDGVCFVDLAPIADTRGVAVAIAQALPLVAFPDEPIEHAVKRYLRDCRLLLVLDNFEQVLTAAVLLTGILETCPGLRVLVTSRVRLAVRWEHVFEVPSLTLPDPQELTDLASVQTSEAVTLFIQRARACQSNFQLTEANAPDVAAICTRLDGLPLALELAAVRLTILSPAMLREQLVNRLTILTNGPQDVPARQQTIRATIDWSHDLLTPNEQMLFRRLAVFVDGCTVEAAAKVCHQEEGLESDLLQGLESLVNNHLLRKSDDPGELEPRVRMLETIHEYARERLAESGDAPMLRHRHARYFSKLSQEAVEKIDGPDYDVFLSRVYQEGGNLQAAIEWAQDDEVLRVDEPMDIERATIWLSNRNALMVLFTDALSRIPDDFFNTGLPVEVGQRLKAMTFTEKWTNKRTMAFELAVDRLLAATASPVIPLPTPRGGLTPKQWEVAMLIANEALTDKEIAQRLGMSLLTAKTHVSVIRRKFDIQSRGKIRPYLEENNML